MNDVERYSFSALYPILKEEIDRGNSFSFTAFGNSMHPFIRGGKDRVTLSPITENLRAGDVIFYRRQNGMFVLHRIIRVTETGFDLCGDNQYWIESGIQPEQVIAIMTKLEKKGLILSPSSLKSRIWRFFLPFRRLFLHFLAYIKVRTKH